jgi:natural product precursor
MKINFARAHQVLSEKEMKNVLGGSGGSGWCDFKDGTSVLAGCRTDADCVRLYGEGTCSS